MFHFTTDLEVSRDGLLEAVLVVVAVASALVMLASWLL